MLAVFQVIYIDTLSEKCYQYKKSLSSNDIASLDIDHHIALCLKLFANLYETLYGLSCRSW